MDSHDSRANSFLWQWKKNPNKNLYKTFLFIRNLSSSYSSLEPTLTWSTGSEWRRWCTPSKRTRWRSSKRFSTFQTSTSTPKMLQVATFWITSSPSATTTLPRSTTWKCWNSLWSSVLDRPFRLSIWRENAERSKLLKDYRNIFTFFRYSNKRIYFI